MHDLIANHLQQAHTMQLATYSSAGPWICSLFYIVDENLNLYWASTKSRKHSIDIEDNPSVATAVVVKNKIGEGVIGLQISGEAGREVDQAKIAEIAKLYSDKFKMPAGWIDEFIGGQTKHKLYKLVPSSIALFDDDNYPGGKKQIYTIKK